MAAISSMILKDDQADPIFSPLQKEPNAEINETPDTASNDLLAEIQAIQEAMQNEEHFDFTQLESTSAGNSQDLSTPTNNDKSTSAPILLEDSNLLIHYRSSETPTSENEQTLTATSTQETLVDDNENTLLSINNNVDQIKSSVSEDFVTQAQGKFDVDSMPIAQSLTTKFGSFSSDSEGNWQYTLNNELNQIQSLSAGDSINDIISLTSITGQKIQLTIEINGTNDQAIITGSKKGELQATPIEDLDNNHPSISGKLNVADIDQGEARFEVNFDLNGSFGTAQINALGEWTYTLNNHADAVQGLRSGEKLLDVFSVKTLDGSKQLIQINIEGVNDKPLLSGHNTAELDLESNLSTSGSLVVNDPDFGESSFQAHTGIKSSLGYGEAVIDSQGNWTFKLDIEFAKQNEINEGQTRFDSFEVFTADGTSQMVNIPIKGSNTPLYMQSNESNKITLADLLSDTDQADEITTTLHQALAQETPSSQSSLNIDANDSQLNIETTLFLNTSTDTPSLINTNLNDINVS